jgi:hypothetical protein
LCFEALAFTIRRQALQPRPDLKHFSSRVKEGGEEEEGCCHLKQQQQTTPKFGIQLALRSLKLLTFFLLFVKPDFFAFDCRRQRWSVF